MELISKLKAVFGECKRESLCCAHKTSYEVITDKNFFIFDDRTTELPVTVVGRMAKHQLTVNNRNKNENEVCLVKTDKCLFITDAHKKCDCILFNTKKIFFVEISEASNAGKSQKRNHAIKQLGTTISLFKSGNVDISKYEAHAIICFKNGKSRPTQAGFNAKRENFRNTYKVFLDEINEISF